MFSTVAFNNILKFELTLLLMKSAFVHADSETNVETFSGVRGYGNEYKDKFLYFVMSMCCVKCFIVIFIFVVMIERKHFRGNKQSPHSKLIIFYSKYKAVRLKLM